jgi:hypothetical protein
MKTAVKIIIGVAGLVAVSAGVYFVVTKMKKSKSLIDVGLNKAKLAAALPAAKLASGKGSPAGVVTITAAVAAGIVTDAEKAAILLKLPDFSAMAVASATKKGITGMALASVGMNATTDVLNRYVDARVNGQNNSTAINTVQKWADVTYPKA